MEKGKNFSNNMFVLFRILIFTIPLVCSNLPEFFGVGDFLRISGNYEFSKVLYFNVFTSLIILAALPSYIGKVFGNDGVKIAPRMALFLLGFWSLVMLSSLFSVHPIHSVFGGFEKGHGLFMWHNLIVLSFIAAEFSTEQIRSLVRDSIISVGIVASFALWQFFMPSFDYGALMNRAFGTLGHPNYLAALILIVLPLLCSPIYIVKKYIRYGLLIYLCLILLLTKSFLALGLGALYLITYFLKKQYSVGVVIGLSIITVLMVYYLFPEKIHSFVSRYYIWETTLRIISSEPLRILSGFGAESFSLWFDSFKSPELYIFENFGFSADRPHNIWLLFVYQFGLGSALILAILAGYIYKSQKSAAKHALILISLLLCFHFSSITGYIIIMILSLSLIDQSKIPTLGYRWIALFMIAIFTPLSLYGSYQSIQIYQAERDIYQKGNYKYALEKLPYITLYQYKNGDFSDASLGEIYYLEQLYQNRDYTGSCKELTSAFPSAENFIYCGRLLLKTGDTGTAKDFLREGISKLPDLWNRSSPYWDHVLVKKTITGNRFYAKKYGNISELLDILNIPIEKSDRESQQR